MVGDFGWEHEGTKSGVGTVKKLQVQMKPLNLRKHGPDASHVFKVWNKNHHLNSYLKNLISL